MKKKLIALFAACSIITTAAAGLVQTAYAAGPNVRIEYADGATDTQKILNFYYEGVDALTAFGGTYSFSSDAVTVDSGSVTLTFTQGMKEFDTDSCYISFSSFDNGGSSSADGLIATATITVPGDVDVTVELEVDSFSDDNYDDYEDDIGTVSVTIPKNAVTPPVPVVEKEVVAAQAFTTPDYDKDMVVGIFDLDVTGANYDLSNATYNGEKGDVTGETTSVFGPVRITVIINGATSTEALDNVKFD